MSVVGFDVFTAQRYIRMKLIQHVGLAAKVGLNVYDEPAPAGVTGNHIVMTNVSAEDLMVVGAVKVWTNTLWQVEYWARTHDPAVMAEGAALINDALHATSGTMSGSTYGDGNVWTCYRERALALPAEKAGDVTWRRAGGEYRVLVSATT